MVGALGLVGVVAAMMVEGLVDGAVLLAFLQEVLGPQLRHGQVVVLDHLKAHKVAGVREAIEAVGARLIYLPPTRWTAPPSRHAGPISRRSCERRRH
jgi:transposase